MTPTFRWAYIDLVPTNRLPNVAVSLWIDAWITTVRNKSPPRHKSSIWENLWDRFSDLVVVLDPSLKKKIHKCFLKKGSMHTLIF